MILNVFCSFEAFTDARTFNLEHLTGRVYPIRHAGKTKSSGVLKVSSFELSSSTGICQ